MIIFVDYNEYNANNIYFLLKIKMKILIVGVLLTFKLFVQVMMEKSDTTKNQKGH